MGKSNVSYDFSNRAVNLLLGDVRTRLLNMIGVSIDKKSVVVDLGCGKGNLTEILFEQTKLTIGLDADKNYLLVAKKRAKKADFVCADIAHLPLRKNLVDVAVAASVFEFIENLEGAIKETKDMLKKGGILIVGFPIQTTFVKATMKIIDKRAVRLWEPLKVMTLDQCRRDFHTHKQKYSTIREFLGKNLYLLKREKMPLDCLPDSFSIYEFVKMLKID